MVPEALYDGVRSPVAVAHDHIRYVTGRAGMGHVAITSTDPAGIHRCFGTVFDSRLSDFIDENIAGLTLRIRFLRVNERHRSIAVAGTRGVRLDPIRTSVQHVNIQVADLEDMLAAYHRVQSSGFRMAWSVGQHTNDRELSFYCVTPSGFELRWAGIRSLSHPSSKRPGPSAHTKESAFGATMTSAWAFDRLGQLRQAVLHAHPEVTVQELSTSTPGGLIP